MNRREFLKYGASALLGLGLSEFLHPLEAAASNSLVMPHIYKRFFVFTEYEERPVTDTIVIHHTGFPGEDKDTTAAAVHKFHRYERGWAGIGYHYFIRKNGMIEQGRRPNAVGAHVRNHNKHTIGICLAGNFDIGTPTQEQITSLQLLTANLCEQYKLDPMKKGVIVGHRNLGNTSCPGKNLYCRLDELREFCNRR